MVPTRAAIGGVSLPPPPVPLSNSCKNNGEIAPKQAINRRYFLAVHRLFSRYFWCGGNAPHHLHRKLDHTLTRYCQAFPLFGHYYRPVNWILSDRKFTLSELFSVIPQFLVDIIISRCIFTGVGHTPNERGDTTHTTQFQNPGGRSALRRATRRNPRNRPCPTCGKPNRLTPADVKRRVPPATPFGGASVCSCLGGYGK